MSEEEKLLTYATFKGKPIQSMSREELMSALQSAFTYIDHLQEQHLSDLANLFPEDNSIKEKQVKLCSYDGATEVKWGWKSYPISKVTGFRLDAEGELTWISVTTPTEDDRD